MLLVRLNIACTRTLYPDYYTQYHEGTNGVDHYRVVGIRDTEIGKQRVIENGSRSKQFAEQGYRKQYPGVAHAVTEAVKDRLIGLIAHGKRLQSSHHNTIRNNETNKGAKHLVHRIVISFQYLCYQGNERRDYG